jgi:DNA invertase Pin-like site-specific DNA recombinase
VFHVFAALAEFERDLVRERTSAGLVAARDRGHRGGRPSVVNADKLRVARGMHASGQYTAAAIARRLGVSRASVYRHLTPARAVDQVTVRPRRWPVPCEGLASPYSPQARPASTSRRRR